MAKETNYWTRWSTRQQSRRRMLAGAGSVGAGVAALGLVGCGGDDDEADSPTTAAGSTTAPGTTPGAGSSPVVAQPKRGGVLKFPLSIVLKDVFDPHTSLNQAAYFYSLIGNTALRPSTDATKIEGELVQSTEIPASGMEIIMKLRPGVKWHNKPPSNGRAFVADDLAFNLKRITGALNADKAASFQRKSTLPNFESATAIDETTVSVKLTKPHSGFLWGLSDWRNSIVPRDFVESGGKFEDAATLIGTGPWTVESFEGSTKAVFKPNPNTWETGKPYADSVEWIVYADALSAQTAFGKGDLSYIGATGKINTETVKKIASKAREESWAFGNWDHVRYNTTRAPFDDARVRLALSLIYDVKGIGDGFYGAGKWDYTGPLASAFSVDALSSADLAKTKGYNPDSKAADIKEAKDMLSAAGFPDGKGLSFKIHTNSNTGAPFEQATRVRDNLKQALSGIDVELDIASDNTVYARRQVSGDWDVISYTLYPAPDAVIEMTNNVHSAGSRNYGKFKSDEVDALIAKAETQLDARERSTTMKELQKALLEKHMPTAHTVSARQVAMFQPNIKGMEQYGGQVGGGLTWDTLLNFKNAWLDG